MKYLIIPVSHIKKTIKIRKAEEKACKESLFELAEVAARTRRRLLEDLLKKYEIKEL